MTTRSARGARGLWLFLGWMLTACEPITAGDKHNGFVLEPASIPLDEIHHGGPPKDGIPALDQPGFVPGTEADYLRDDDRILGVTIDGISKAYPIRILNYHELVNDRFGASAILVSFCPLCGSGMAFLMQPRDHQAGFGVSGLLFNSDLLLYDRATESLWSQILGRAVSGKRLGEELHAVPIVHTDWSDWLERHPDTLVLDNATGHLRDYQSTPYSGYEHSETLYFPVRARDPRLPAKAWVLGVEIDGHAKAYAFTELAQGPRRITDELAGQEIVLVYDPTHRSAEAFGARGEKLPSVSLYWFAWYAFYPHTDVFQHSVNNP